MTLVDYLTLAAKAIACVWVLSMFLFFAWVAYHETVRPYLRRRRRRHGRRGYVPARVVEMREFRARRGERPL